MPNPELSSTRGPIEIYQRCAGAGDAAALLSRPRHRCLQPELKLEPELIHQPERAFTSTAHSRCWRRCSSGGARGRGRSDKTDCCGTWQEGEQRRAGVESSAAASRAGEMEHIFPGVGADGAWCYSLRGFSRGAKPRRRGHRRRHQLKGSRSSALELFFSNTSTACRRPVAELNGCRAAAPSLFVVLPAKGVLPPGHDADAEVF